MWRVLNLQSQSPGLFWKERVKRDLENKMKHWEFRMKKCHTPNAIGYICHTPSPTQSLGDWRLTWNIYFQVHTFAPLLLQLLFCIHFTTLRWRLMYVFWFTVLRPFTKRPWATAACKGRPPSSPTFRFPTKILRHACQNVASMLSMHVHDTWVESRSKVESSQMHCHVVCAETALYS